MHKQDICIRIAGKSGEGIEAAGEIFSSALAKAGLYVYCYRTFSTAIRGGFTACDIRISSKSISCKKDSIDILITFDEEGLKRSIPEISGDGVIIYDSSTFSPSIKNFTFFSVPLTRLAEKAGNKVMKNIVSLGFLFGLLNFEMKYLNQAIRKEFLKRKKPVEPNLIAAKLGKDFQKELNAKFNFSFSPTKPKLLMSGNEAIAFGALVAGCKFFAGYPITPSTSIFEYLASKLPEFDGVVVQCEDELAAINMIIGASYAGARAMTATSGPGFSLMVEGIGFSSMAEIPVVIANVQRVGPSTGIPTGHSQDDLDLVTHCSHGDVSKIVVAPTSLEECFYLTLDAFNLADEFQCPVIILVDQALGLSLQTLDELDSKKVKIERKNILTSKQLKGIKEFKRYKLTPSGISPIFFPPQKGKVLISSSVEHDEDGFYTDLQEIRKAMAEKRLRKLKKVEYSKTISNRFPLEVCGDKDAEVALISFGSSRGAILEVVEKLKKIGKKIKFVNLSLLYPIPTNSLKKVLKNVKKVFVIENNSLGQLRNLLADIFEGKEVRSVLKYDGTPFTPKDIVAGIR